jgi:uncharacterized lipoprotein
MKRAAAFAIAGAVLVVLSGCNSGVVTDQQQKDKQAAMEKFRAKMGFPDHKRQH